MFVTRINQGPRLPSFSELVSSLAYEQDHQTFPPALHPHPGMAPVPQRPVSIPGPAILSLLPMDRQHPLENMDSRQGLPLGSPLGLTQPPQNQHLMYAPPLLASPGLVTPLSQASSITPATLVSSYNSNLGYVKPEENREPRMLSKRKHTCKTCGRLFTTLGHLARHFRTHTGERKHVCPWADCGARFARQDNCMQHYKTHLNGKNKRR